MIPLEPPTQRGLPDPPRVDLWPPAVRSAELLKGSLVRCGTGVRPIGWPDTPRVRSAALASVLAGGCAAIGMTAAWVWGASRSPDFRPTVSTLRGVRAAALNSAERTLRELTLRDDDLQWFGSRAVTTPGRTVFDLLHASQPFTLRHVVACRLLALQLRGGVGEISKRMEQQPRYSNRVLARSRMAHIWGTTPH